MDDEDDMVSVSGTPVAPKKKGRPRLLPIATMATPTTISSTASTVATPSVGGAGTVIVTNANNSPKARFPNNPVLKKKLLGLQKFLSEYIVSVLF